MRNQEKYLTVSLLTLKKDDMKTIEKFISNEMTPIEEEVFKRKMETDEALALEVEKMRLIAGGVRVMGMKENIKNIQTAFFEEEKQQQQRKNLWIAAILILLIGGAFSLNYFLAKPKTATLPTIYAANYAVYPMESTLGSGKDLILKQATIYYKDGEYDKAIEFFEGYLNGQNQLDKNIIYLSICHIETQNHEKAILTLKPLIEEETIFANTARWYTALAYLQLENREKAISYCQTILKTTNKASKNYKAAKTLLKALEK